MKKDNRRKWTVHICTFAAVMALTFWSVFRNQDFAQMAASARKLSILSLTEVVFLAAAFVAGEGCMIWYLLKGIGEKTSLRLCISYSFIGFFFSGITPSATGGQPMQLYYMKKDGNSLSSSSVVLMTVAVMYKFVLALTGTGILLFGRRLLKNYFQGYEWLYLFGLLLNIVVVAALILVMFSPGIIKAAFFKTERLFIRLRLWKKSELRENKVEQFLSGYQETVCFLRNHKRMIGVVATGTFAQRFSVFLLTYVIYRGLGLHGFSMWDIVWLQASVCIAVDMLPVPGAQGITEAMFQSVFLSIFTKQYLTVSICITRGISFYLMLLLGFCVFVIRHQLPKQPHCIEKKNILFWKWR